LQPGQPPRFSVITAAYQAAGTIAESVQSALAQTLPAHEVIVVDDGSTDDIDEVLAPVLDRIVFLRQPNRGAPAAMNTGLRAASGDFVVVLDADDAYEPERLEALSELAVARPDLDLLMTDASLVAAGEVVGRFCEHTQFATLEQSVAILGRCFLAWPAVRCRRLIDAGGFDETMRIAYDWECWVRLLHDGAKAGLVDEPLIRYRIAGSGSLTDNRVAALRDRVRVLERAVQLDLTPEERAEAERFLPRRRRDALLAEAQLALREDAADARRRSLAVAGASGMPARTRLRAAAAALAPRLAAARLERREARTGQSRIRRHIPPGPPG
jgi:hypothetical protein